MEQPQLKRIEPPPERCRVTTAGATQAHFDDASCVRDLGLELDELDGSTIICTTSDVFLIHRLTIEIQNQERVFFRRIWHSSDHFDRDLHARMFWQRKGSTHQILAAKLMLSSEDGISRCSVDLNVLIGEREAGLV